MKTIKTTLLATAFALAGVGQAHASFAQLSQVRDQIVLPQYTPEQKQLIAEQAQLFIKGMYVHRYEKDIYYGTSPNASGHLTPVETMERIVANVNSLSSDDLHRQIQSLFLSQRDLHLNYNYPFPHAGFVTFLPFEFERATANGDDFEIRVSALWNRFFPLVPNVRLPEVGDKVITYNDLLVADAVNQQIPVGGGANRFGGFVRAMDSLRIKSHRSAEVPTEDFVRIEFESGKTGERFVTEIPWIAYNSQAQARAADTKTTAIDVAELAKQSAESSNQEFMQHQALKAQAQSVEGSISRQQTAEPTLSWSTTEVDGRLIGYLHIASFVPKTSPNTAIQVVLDLLDNQFKHTDALVIDVRNNGGGNIIYADTFYQLFTPKTVDRTYARYLNTPLNQHIMQNTIFSTLGENWVNVLREVEGSSQRYTATSNWVSVDAVNGVGQAYYKPVAVWANARTYSSGDLFACGMQDNGIARLYGDDPQTGAGGANVLEHSLFATYAGEPFKALPYGQSMRVSWRQSVRFGHHQNELIEDYGCYADVKLNKSVNDVIDGGQNNLKQIARNLLSQPLARSAVEFTQPRFFARETQGNTINFAVKNTEHVNVYINGEKVQTKTVYAYGSKAKSLSFTLPDNIKVPARVKIVGVDAGQQPLWNSTRFVL